ncbi:hypothetical protein PC120_g25528 [Phytophthora cactorum]|nr:hypothetical protein PC120_g25528 [Phytophthora cactorum]
MKMKAVLFASTVTFSDQSLNLDEDVADMLVATLFLLYPDMLRFCASSPFVVKTREDMVARSIDRLGVVLKLVQRQTEQISVLILQNKQLEERLLAVEDKLHTPSGTTTQEGIGSSTATSVNTEPYSQPPPKAARAKRKGSQSLVAMWFEWFTAESSLRVAIYQEKSTIRA